MARWWRACSISPVPTAATSEWDFPAPVPGSRSSTPTPPPTAARVGAIWARSRPTARAGTGGRSRRRSRFLPTRRSGSHRQNDAQRAMYCERPGSFRGAGIAANFPPGLRHRDQHRPTSLCGTKHKQSGPSIVLLHSASMKSHPEYPMRPSIRRARQSLADTVPSSVHPCSYISHSTYFRPGKNLHHTKDRRRQERRPVDLHCSFAT